MQYFIDCVTKKYAAFDGRARRAEYWWFALGHFVLTAPFFFIGSIITAVTADPYTGTGGGFGVFVSAIGWLVSLGLFLPGLAVTIRRLHDTNKPGLWVLISFVPFGGFVLLYFMLVEGDRGPNTYGQDPKGGGYTQPGAGQFGAAQFGAPAAGGSFPASGQPQQPYGVPAQGQSQFGAQAYGQQEQSYGVPEQYGQAPQAYSAQPGQGQQYGQQQYGQKPYGQ